MYFYITMSVVLAGIFSIGYLLFKNSPTKWDEKKK